MSLSILEHATEGVEDTPPKVVIYGDPGIGKTTFASCAPSPYIINIEGGTKKIKLGKKTKQCTEFSSVMEHLSALCGEEHGYQTVVVDTATRLERLIHAHADEKHTDKELSYGRKFTEVAPIYWQEVLDALDYLNTTKNMCVIMVAHASVQKFKNPLTEAYDRYNLDLRTDASAMIREWADAVLFATLRLRIEKEDVGFNKTRSIAKPIGADGGEHILRVNDSPAFVAKNRYDITGDIPLTWEAFAQYL